MGMRRHIALKYNDKDSKIYLYTHWGAEGLELELAKTLDRARERWTDHSYLGRIIFTDITQDVGESLTGYGLSPYVTDDEYPTIEVDLETQMVNGVPYEDFIKRPEQFSIHEPNS
jgi:hypothetical protein